jgi:hypothetical protein
MGAASRPAQATRARRRGTAEAKKLVKRGAHRFFRFAQPGKAAGARGTNRVRRRKQAQKRKRSAAQEAGGAGNRRLPGDGTSGPVKKLRIPRKWEKWESNVRPPRAWGTALKGCQIIHVVQDSESKKASSPSQTRPKYLSLARSLPPPFPLVASSPLPPSAVSPAPTHHSHTRSLPPSFPQWAWQKYFRPLGQARFAEHFGDWPADAKVLLRVRATGVQEGRRAQG